jgi:hypothetical protein
VSQVPDEWTSLLTGVPITLASMYAEMLTSAGIAVVKRQDPRTETIYGFGNQSQELLVRTSDVEQAKAVLDADQKYLSQ